MQVAGRRRIASVGARILGSARSSTRTSPRAVHHGSAHRITVLDGPTRPPALNLPGPPRESPSGTSKSRPNGGSDGEESVLRSLDCCGRVRCRARPTPAGGGGPEQTERIAYVIDTATCDDCHLTSIDPDGSDPLEYPGLSFGPMVPGRHEARGGRREGRRPDRDQPRRRRRRERHPDRHPERDAEHRLHGVVP